MNKIIYLEEKETIKKAWEENPSFIENLISDEILGLICMSNQDSYFESLIERDFHKILNISSIDYDMFNFFTILALREFKNGNYKSYCDSIIEITIKSVFSKETIFYLRKKFNKIKTAFTNKESLFNEIIADLQTFNTEKSSKIIFDLYIFPDFKIFLETNKRVLATLIEAYQLYDPDLLSSHLFKGSSIIGKLLKTDNEKIVAKHLRDLLEEKQISTRNIKMIGGGASSLVYRINNKVIKLGETRHCRKIYINHRILASIVRKLETSPEGEELFYVETMINAIVGDVTEEERDELVRDLAMQGLNWEDTKLENCGRLPDGYENECDLPVDYIEVAGRIDNPYYREQFMRRDRKVVVIDNDDITLNPLKLCR